MSSRALTLATLVGLAFSAPAVSAAPAAPHAAAGSRYSLELARKVVNLSSPRVSLDGRSIAFLVSKPDFEKNKNVTELWLADATTGEPHALTFDRRSVSTPQWSPDGRTLAFLAPDDAEHPQIWLLALRGGKCRDVRQKRKIIEQDVAQRPPPGARRVGGERTLVG